MSGYPRLEGLIAAPFTPMHADGGIAPERIEKLAEHLVRSGVKGAFVCGTTGESLSMTIEERMAIAQQWVNVAGDKLRIIVHVGDCSQAHACALAAHAAKLKVFAVSAMSPCFFKPADVTSVVDWLRPVAASAPGTPFYYYHIPSMTGVALPMVKLLNAIGDTVPTFRGIKFTHYDLPEYQQCLSACGGKYDISFGRDEALLAGVAMGALSAVGSTYNYSAAVYLRMWRAFLAGDIAAARRYSLQAIEFIDILIRYGGLRCGKAIMSLIGHDLGPTRSPITPLSEKEKMALRTDLEKIGFFEAVAAE